MMFRANEGRGLLFATALAVSMLAAHQARADDECDSDEDCVDLYDEDFVCVSGSLGRYCVERGCTSDSECEEKYGEDSWCESWGTEARCSVPSPPKYVPPFKSMCSATPGARGSWLALALFALAAGLLRRRSP